MLTQQGPLEKQANHFCFFKTYLFKRWNDREREISFVLWSTLQMAALAVGPDQTWEAGALCQHPMWVTGEPLGLGRTPSSAASELSGCTLILDVGVVGISSLTIFFGVLFPEGCMQMCLGL